ncbi:hypothetical protein ACFX2H_015350 [Malus domestica]
MSAHTAALSPSPVPKTPTQIPKSNACMPQIGSPPFQHLSAPFQIPPLPRTSSPLPRQPSLACKAPNQKFSGRILNPKQNWALWVADSESAGTSSAKLAQEGDLGRPFPPRLPCYGA